MLRGCISTGAGGWLLTAPLFKPGTRSSIQSTATLEPERLGGSAAWRGSGSACTKAFSQLSASTYNIGNNMEN